MATNPRLRNNGWTKCRAAAVRLNELVRLSLFRQKKGLTLHASSLLFVACNALCFQKHGADWITVSAWLLKADMTTQLSEPDIMARIHSVSRFAVANPTAGPLRPDKAGDVLQLTSAEREVLLIRTMDATDETAAMRRVRLKAIRNEKAKLSKAKSRRNTGMLSRSVYLASALAASRPWEREGISRRTWERRRKAVASLSTYLMETNKTADTLATLPC
jgi:hypothetical protein